MSPLLLIAVAGTALHLLLAFVARVPTYRVAPLFLVPVLWGVYLLRRRIDLHPLHYLLFASALLLHNLGAFGFYQRAFLGLSFDIYVHFYFAFVGTFLIRRALAHQFPLRPWQSAAAALMFVMGCGAIHELLEYVSFRVLGEERGMLKPSTSYFFDTQRDLLNNLLGACTALLLSGIARLRSGGRRRPLRSPAEVVAA